jgi:ParB family chromosome partitioning protein
LGELAESIRSKGVVQPILVRPAPHDAARYEIVAGERRWRAAQRVPLHDVPVVIQPLSDADVFEIALIENIQRQDLNPIEEAQAYQHLIDSFGHTQEALAGLMGKSRSHIANLLRLLDLPESVRTHVMAGRLSMGHARAIVTAHDPASLAEQVIARGLSVRQTEALATAQRTAPAKGGRKPANGRGKDPDTAALERDLSAALGMPVEIAGAGPRGALTIRYESLDALDELCRRLAAPRSGF